MEKCIKIKCVILCISTRTGGMYDLIDVTYAARLDNSA